MPKLVLLPGMDGTGSLFVEFIAALPSSFEVVAARYPTDQYLTNTEMQDLVRAVCPHSEPFTLLAESFSTPLAIQYASTRPSNLKSLILCAGFATSPLDGWRRRLASLVTPVVLAVGLREHAIKAFLLDRDAPPDLVRRVSRAISSISTEVLVGRVRDVLRCDVRVELAQIAAPILYLQAQRDCLIGGTSFTVVKGIQPQTAVVVFDAPHLLLQSQPQRIADAVVGFLHQSEGG